MSAEPEPCEEQCMELLVETLTGTSFEMKVDPSDTILDIKRKIQRVEGKKEPLPSAFGSHLSLVTATWRDLLISF